jgi:hypothetical protein
VLPVVLLYAPSTLNDGPAAAFLVAAAARLVDAVDDPRASRAGVIAGLYAGGAYLFRFTAPLFLVGPFLYMVYKNRRAALGFAGGAGAVIVAIGLFDWPTWGAPFLSVARYLDFNVLSGRSAQFGVEPAWFYLDVMVRELGPLAPFTIALAAIGGARTRGVGIGVLIGVILIGLSPHKEDRFLFPFFAFAPALVALGAARIVETLARWRWPAAIGLLVVVLGSSAWTMRGRDLLGLSWSPRGLRAVSARPDVRGVLVGLPADLAGGYVSLHRQVPFIPVGDLMKPEVHDLLAHDVVNYVVVSTEQARARDSWAHGIVLDEVARVGDAVILRRK